MGAGHGGTGAGPRPRLRWANRNGGGTGPSRPEAPVVIESARLGPLLSRRSHGERHHHGLPGGRAPCPRQRQR